MAAKTRETAREVGGRFYNRVSRCCLTAPGVPRNTLSSPLRFNSGVMREKMNDNPSILRKPTTCVCMHVVSINCAIKFYSRESFGGRHTHPRFRFFSRAVVALVFSYVNKNEAHRLFAERSKRVSNRPRETQNAVSLVVASTRSIRNRTRRGTRTSAKIPFTEAEQKIIIGYRATRPVAINLQVSASTAHRAGKLYSTERSNLTRSFAFETKPSVQRWRSLRPASASILS